LLVQAARLEAQWACSAAVLALELARGARANERRLFQESLAECEFADYAVDTLSQTALGVAPLFSQQWEASQALGPGADAHRQVPRPARARQQPPVGRHLHRELARYMQDSRAPSRDGTGSMHDALQRQEWNDPALVHAPAGRRRAARHPVRHRISQLQLLAGAAGGQPGRRGRARRARADPDAAGPSRGRHPWSRIHHPGALCGSRNWPAV